MFSDVHAQSSGTTAESVSLRSVLASVTNLTEELILVSVGVGRVQHLVAQAFKWKKKLMNFSNFNSFQFQLFPFFHPPSIFTCQSSFFLHQSSMLNINLPHLKHCLCHFMPPATRSSAAYTDLEHLGHLEISAGTKGILKR